jgi:hypothetical protein
MRGLAGTVGERGVEENPEVLDAWPVDVFMQSLKTTCLAGDALQDGRIPPSTSNLQILQRRRMWQE